MLYVETKGDQHFSWHIGDGSLKEVVENSPGAGSITDVVMVQADGDELSAIVHQIQNIPRARASARVTAWYGDDAKFIVANLR